VVLSFLKQNSRGIGRFIPRNSIFCGLNLFLGVVAETLANKGVERNSKAGFYLIARLSESIRFMSAVV